MLREIKFRGKRVDNGDWVYGSLLADLDNRFFIVADQGTWRTYDEAIPETVGQFTGLKDKNSKEIFDGDIVKVGVNQYENPKEYTAKVIWQDFRALFAVEFNQCANNDLYKYIQNGNCVEVIGNIYEHPELFKGGSTND